MTAATGPATAAKGGRRVSATVRHAAEIATDRAGSETAARPVPGPRAPAPATGAGSGRTVVAGGPDEVAATHVPGGPATTSPATVGHLSPQASAKGLHTVETLGAHGAPGSATPVEGGRKMRQHLADTEAAGTVRGPRPGQGPPGSASPVEGRQECAAVAYVEALDGSERTILLTHIARAYPDVVAAGAQLVAQWRADAAEHRRKRLRRNDHDRRKRRRAEAGGGG